MNRRRSVSRMLKGEIIEFPFPLLRPHAGIAMGNGMFGALVWGRDGINITVNRADFWDHRGAYRPMEGVTTYENIRKYYNPADASWMSEVYPATPKPHDAGNPSRLPFGRFEMKLKTGYAPVKGCLDFDGGTLAVLLAENGGGCRSALYFDLSVERNILWIRDPGEIICGVTVRTAWEFVSGRLQTLGFKEPVRLADSQAWGWSMGCPADPAMAALCVRGEGGFVISLERGKNPGKAFAAAREAVSDAVTDSLAAMRKANMKWWRGYWRRSPRIDLPDEFFSKFYKYAMYKFGAATNPQSRLPAGLQGPWVEEYQWPAWNACYVFDENVQQLYTLAFGANQFEHLMPLFDLLDSWKGAMRRNAKVIFGIDDGLVIGMCSDDRGEVLYPGSGILIDHACSGWAARLFWLYYKYTGDIGFLRERAYPFMYGVMRVFEEMLEDEGGRFSIPLCISAEFGNDIKPRYMGKDPSWQLACVHMLVDALLEASRILKMRARPIWREIKMKLPPYTLIGKPGEEHVAVWEGQDLDFCHRHHSHLSSIYPFDSLGKLTPDKKEILERSVDHWISKGMGHWSEWCMPWAAIIQTRMGFKDSPWLILQIWRKLFVNEGLATVYIPRFRGFSVHRSSLSELRAKPLDKTETMQLDGMAGAVTAIYEMLVHVREGVTYVFPAVPDDMEDIRFTDIRIPGAFLVSAERKKFKLRSIRVKSLIGGEITLHAEGNPEMALVEAGRRRGRVRLPAVLSFKPGEALRLEGV